MKPESVELGVVVRLGVDPVSLEEFERTVQTARAAQEAIRSMAKTADGLTDSFQTVSAHFRGILAGLRPGPDAVRWCPELLPDITPDTPVRHCLRMLREEAHPGHPDLDPSNRLVQCPGYPLPSILDLLPECETDDDRTCTESCPLHG